MQAEQSILDRIQRRRLKWYIHLRINAIRWPKMIYQWTPNGEKRNGRSQQSQKRQVMNFMRIRNIDKDVAENSHLWRLGMDRQLLAV